MSKQIDFSRSLQDGLVAAHITNGDGIHMAKLSCTRQEDQGNHKVACVLFIPAEYTSKGFKLGL